MDGIARERFAWDAQIQRDDGEVIERRVEVYWRPDQEDSARQVAVAAAAMASCEGAQGRRRQFVPIGAVRVGA